MTTREIYESPNVIDVEYTPKLECIFTMFNMAEEDLTEGYDHIIIEGGRGSSKSENVACALVLISRVVSIRILCTREIQKSIKDSSKHMLERWINKLGLRDEFHITDNQIINKVTGTDFIFAGMRAMIQFDTLKSLDDVSLVFYEEAAKATMKSLEVLDPTIRNDYRKLIYVLNPESEKDATEVFFKGKERVLRIHVDYLENPFCPQTIINQAEEMKRLDYDQYLYVFRGKRKPEDVNSIILPYAWLTQCIDLHLRVKHSSISQKDLDTQYKTYGGFDVADGMTTAHDKNSLVLRRGPVVTHAEEWQIEEVYKSVQHINNQHAILGFQVLHYDATAVGVAAKSEFARIEEQERKLPYDIYPFSGAASPQGKKIVYTGEDQNKITNGAMFANLKAQGWWNLRLRAENSLRLLRGEKIYPEDYYLSFSSTIPDLDSMLRELAQATFRYNNSGRLLVDKTPGMNTVIVDGEEVERKSPNKADACKYAFASDLAGGIQAHSAQRLTVEVI